MKARTVVFGIICSFALVFLAAPPAEAQFRGPAGPPNISGVWNPVEGAGAAYRMEGKGTPQEIEMAIVGSERVGTEQGYWLEISVQDARQGQAVMKTLFVPRGGTLDPKRMIVQAAGQPPMEIPMEMRGRMGMPAQDQKTDIREDSIHVGKATITTPAGTFECDHYRSQDGKTEVWINSDVHPYGMVKMTSPDATMTLVRKVTNAKTKISGTPMRMDQMMPRPR